LPLYRRAAEGIERVFGAEHPTTKTIRANYETVLREVGQAGGPKRRMTWRHLITPWRRRG
jgi:hypothetical protein